VKIKIDGVEANASADAFSFEGGSIVNPLAADAMAGALRSWARDMRERIDRRERLEASREAMGEYADQIKSG